LGAKNFFYLKSGINIKKTFWQAPVGDDVKIPVKNLPSTTIGGGNLRAGADVHHCSPAHKPKIPVFTGMTAGKYMRCTQ
jgi:hypothetical protein